jgi:hypothetical protein
LTGIAHGAVADTRSEAAIARQKTFTAKGIGQRIFYAEKKKVVEMGGVEPPSKMFNRMALQA